MRFGVLIRIRSGKGALVTIAGTPRTGSDNRELHGGVTCGVIKLLSDQVALVRHGVVTHDVSPPDGLVSSGACGALRIVDSRERQVLP
jgi:hypothetical protein